ncbi:MAG TPA: hypothetical protein VH595_02610 [Verrucomicrobiae bacterium]|jgi:hypothetical protein|nr:hypothetical protein [Verrucomicrobiae bacterium]
MSRNITETARVLGVERDQVKKWASLFQEYLGKQANPGNGGPRSFSDLDLMVFAYIATLWEAKPDLEAIKIGLNQEEHLEEGFYKLLYLNSPILQEPPDGLDETWQHGVLWIGGHGQEQFELARNYRYAAETMLDLALKRGETRHWICPLLFAYRHTLELYLKIIGEISAHTHSLATCVELVETRHGAKFNSRAKGWIQELDKIDPQPGTAFRYEDDLKKRQDYTEYWIDLRQFKFAMSEVFQRIDMAILDLGPSNKLITKRK